ncbi:MAG: chemotaxis protein CheW [Bacillaceae bacterium]|nr:chemotaxis protein CheW [Bacillaceae bacterium]
MSEKYVTFIVNGEEMALPIDSVEYIESVGDITDVPKTDECVAGVGRIRGKVIPIVDVKCSLFGHKTELTDSIRLIGVHHEGRDLAFLVDEARDVLDISHEDIQQVENVAEKKLDIAKIGDRMVLLLKAEYMIQKFKLEDMIEDLGHQL